MIVVSYDHSLTAFGMVAVRPSWGCDFLRVERCTLQTMPGPVVPRRALLVADAVSWTAYQARRYGVPLSKVRAVIEGGIFMRGKAETIRSQERLAGVLEHELDKQLGIELTVVEQRHARTVFMGKSLSGGRGAGEAAQELLKAVLPNPLDWDEAELDAFIVANAALFDAGEAFVSVADNQPKRGAA
jgi:hypothetical protein